MKNLIINADDLGLSKEVNAAVECLYRAGRITGTSIMARAERFPEAVRMLKDVARTDVGVHLTLTGHPFPFPDRNSFILRYLTGSVKADYIYSEFKAEIEKVLEAGLQVTHLDGHEHLHMFPGIFSIVLKLASEFKIPYVRISGERSLLMKSFSVGGVIRYLGMKVFVIPAKRRISGTSTKYNNALRGFVHFGKLTDALLIYMLNNLTEGVTELVVHPGLSKGELDVLLNGSWKAHAATIGIHLIPHS